MFDRAALPFEMQAFSFISGERVIDVRAPIDEPLNCGTDGRLDGGRELGFGTRRHGADSRPRAAYRLSFLLAMACKL